MINTEYGLTQFEDKLVRIRMQESPVADYEIPKIINRVRDMVQHIEVCGYERNIKGVNDFYECLPSRYKAMPLITACIEYVIGR